MNKTKLFFVCGACLTAGVAPHAGAQPFDETKGYMFYARSGSTSLKKIIAPSTRNLSVDEAIIALSKASDINFIADATQIPSNTFVEPFPATPVAREHKWKPTFYGVTGDFEEATQLAELRYDKNTFLLWKRPDVVQTANALRAAGKLLPPSPLPDQIELYHTLDNFQQNSQGWKTSPPDPAAAIATFRMGDVPSATREPLLALLRYSILRPDWKRDLMLSDSFWEAARVLVVTPRPNMPATKSLPLIYVSGQDEKGQALPFFRVDRRLDLLDANLERTLYPKVTTAGVAAPAFGPDGVPPAPIAEPITPVAVGLTTTELEAQEPLKVPVSLEVRRQPLNAILAEASKQCGVPLSTAAGISPLLITARVQAMPLHELMGALGRLSGASWRKSAVGYELQALPLENWQKLLLQSGEGDFDGDGIESQYTPEELQPLRDLQQSVADELSDQKMTPQGVPFSTLSEDLREQIKQTVRFAAADALVRAYNNAFVFASPEGMVGLGRRTPFLNASLPFSQTNFTEWNVGLLDAGNYMTITDANLSLPPKIKDANALPGDEPIMPAPGGP